jgi:hypothetical protein
MSTILPNYQTEDIFYQPQLTRYHHAHRSPRNTERMNLEINQLRYDVFKLYEFISNVDSNLVSYFRSIENAESGVPAALGTVTGLDDLNMTVQRLANRIEILEKGL